MRGRGISSAEDFRVVEWTRFPGAARGHHITVRAQEFLLSEAFAVVHRGALVGLCFEPFSLSQKNVSLRASRNVYDN